MNSEQAALQGKDSACGERDLYVSFELGNSSWKLTFGDRRCAPKRYQTSAGDTQSLSRYIATVKARLGLGAMCRVRSCYEAGRDGWWLHRWLLAQGIDNIVVDAASIEVDRRARRAKTDRIDGDKLLRLLMQYHDGDLRVWSVVRAPSCEEEDERWLHRELKRLDHERTAHVNRVRSFLVMFNLRVHACGFRKF